MIALLSLATRQLSSSTRPPPSFPVRRASSLALSSVELVDKRSINDWRTDEDGKEDGTVAAASFAAFGAAAAASTASFGARDDNIDIG